MCGITGFVGNVKNKKKVIKDMADAIAHRGPDSEGFYVDDNVALGFRRLSIIDLSGGDQPIYSEDGTKLIIFNGEIYNYKEIKKELTEKGYKFKTSSDTEVLLNGYIEYKEKILDKVRGMFAFVIYDIKTKELFGARDFFGIKPFYYYLEGDTFMFASEIKSFMKNPLFKKELNESILPVYLTFQYNASSESLFKNVYKLRPGHYFKYKNGKLSIKEYYDIKYNEDDEKTLEEWTDELRSALKDTVKAHKVSDTEVGSFLSSGVDSSFIAATSNVDKTFTVGYDNKEYSEIDFAKETAKNIGVKNISKKISKEEWFSKIPLIEYHMDEPLGDAASISLYFVANIASEHVKVCLSGEGADEVFLGYNVYTEPLTVTWYNKIPFFIRKLIKTILMPLNNKRGINFLIRRGTKLEDRYVGNAFVYNESEIKSLLNKDKLETTYKDITAPQYKKVKDEPTIKKMQYIDFKFWFVEDILLKADKMSMANSLEVRVPFTDRYLLDLVNKIPTHYKVDKNETKKIFRRIAKEHLEGKVANKKKLGFPVPLKMWLKEDDIYNEVKEKFENNEFFDKDYTMKLLNDHKEGKKDNTKKIWVLYIFLVWYDVYFTDKYEFAK